MVLRPREIQAMKTTGVCPNDERFALTPLAKANIFDI